MWPVLGLHVTRCQRSVWACPCLPHSAHDSKSSAKALKIFRTTSCNTGCIFWRLDGSTALSTPGLPRHAQFVLDHCRSRLSPPTPNSVYGNFSFRVRRITYEARKTKIALVSDSYRTRRASVSDLCRSMASSLRSFRVWPGAPAEYPLASVVKCSHALGPHTLAVVSKQNLMDFSPISRFVPEIHPYPALGARE